jgi:hypothetical protein
VRVIYQALLGLQHLHEQGMVHRDFKPSNLMVIPPGTPGPGDTTQHSTVKILDMSLARALSDESIDESAGEPQLTTEGTLLGTPDYMAPEQARDAHAADIRADIYSLGCVLYHLLAGQPPFPDSNIISQMIRHASETPRPLKELTPAVPDGLQQIVSCMMAKEPTKRYPTPERAAQALQAFLSAEAVPAANPEAEARMRSFLTWLELGDEPAPSAKPAAPPSPPKAAAPPVARPAVAVAAPAPKPAAEKHRSKKQRRQEARAAAAAVPPAPEEGFDVELLPAAPAAAKAGFLARLSRRDFVAFGVGAGSVLAAIFVGWIVAKIAGH